MLPEFIIRVSDPFAINPNFTFRLKGYENAKKVILAGDFNNWNPEEGALNKLKNGDLTSEVFAYSQKSIEASKYTRVLYVNKVSIKSKIKNSIYKAYALPWCRLRNIL